MIEAPASKSFTGTRPLPQKNRISPLVWMNLVCLDAPLVAVSWHWLFARSFGIKVPWGATAALFLTSWLIYLADRFGDALSLGDTSRVSLRQAFCLRHRKLWTSALGVIALADFAMVATALDPIATVIGAVVGLFAFVYLLINRVAPTAWRIVPLKEISIGFIFAAGTLVGLVRGLTSAVLPVWLLFAMLCALNCISIAVWERELDVAQGRISIATELSNVSRWLLPALVLIAVSAAAVAFSSPSLGVALSTSAVLLALVHLRRESIQPDVRTALADLVLLTPLAALAFG